MLGKKTITPPKPQTLYKIKLKWMIGSNVKHQLQRGKVREENLQDLGVDLIPKAQSTEGNTDKLYLMKIKPFAL